MRLAAQAKAGYYPTPIKVVEQVRLVVRFPDKPFAALDPCCGTGEALAVFLSGTNGIGYGVELDRGRAEAARKVLRRVIHAPFETCSITPDAFSVLWLNPPYDTEASAEETRKGLRAEYTFLSMSTRLLTPGGLLVYVIPQHVLRVRDVANYLSYRYEGIRVAAFPPEEGQYQQVVVLGRRARTGRQNPALRDRILALGSETLPRLPEWLVLADDDAPDEAIPVPPMTQEVRQFISRSPSPADLYHEAARGTLWAVVRQRSEVRPAGRVCDQPPLTLRAGHLPLLVAGGAFNGLVGEPDSPHLAKGVVRYEIIVTEEELDDERTEIRETRVPKVVVSLLSADGELRRLT